MTEYDPLDLDGQRKKRQFSEDELKKRLEQEKADFQWLMSHKQGRRLVWRQLEEAGVFGGIFDESHAVMSLREGLRNAGLRLLARVMRYCPETYNRMQEENVTHG